MISSWLIFTSLDHYLKCNNCEFQHPSCTKSAQERLVTASSGILLWQHGIGARNRWDCSVLRAKKCGSISHVSANSWKWLLEMYLIARVNIALCCAQNRQPVRITENCISWYWEVNQQQRLFLSIYAWVEPGWCCCFHFVSVSVQFAPKRLHIFRITFLVSQYRICQQYIDLFSCDWVHLSLNHWFPM